VATRIVRGTVLDVTGDQVTIAMDTDPDTGEVLTMTARLPPAPLPGAVATVAVSEHGATVFGGAGAVEPFAVRFDTYAELRDGITVPRAASVATEQEE